MDRSLILERFLKMESESNVSAVQIEGIELWPIVRTSLLFSLMQLDVPRSQLVCLQEKVTKYLRLSVNVVRSQASFATLNSRKCDAVAVSTTTLRRSELDSKYVDAVYDYYNLAIPSLLIMEEPHKLSHKIPRYSSNIVDLDWVMVRGRILSHLNFRAKSRARSFLRDVEAVLVESGLMARSNSGLSANRIVESIRKGVYIAEALALLQPKVVFMNAASYGGYKAVVCKACRDMNIVVAEAQHGVANMHHPAYNYPANYESRFGQYLPNYYLTYGTYWSEELQRLPSKKVTIGYPYLSEYLMNTGGRPQEITCGGDSLPERVLVLSQPTITEELLHIAVELDRCLSSNYNIIYKLHPAERLNQSHYELLRQATKISIVRDCDLYDLIGSCDAVVGGYSTALFEAIAFMKPVFALGLPIARRYLPRNWVSFFTSASELANMIRGRQYQMDVPNIEAVWASGWRTNLAKFLRMIGVNSCIP